MGLIKITADMTESERTAVINTNMQYLQLSNRLRKYPIGMIVAFATDIDPNKLYGGTWERIKGRVIWGIDDGETAGCTGGEKTHTLTEAELPVIDGKFATAVVSQHGSKGVDGHAYGTTFPTVSDHIKATGAAAEQFGYGYKFGGGQPHNNMMPYYGAYVWRKTGHGIGEDPTLTEYEAFVQQMNTAISEALAKERLTTNATCANALRGSASGSSVSLTDVSPNEHTLGVKVRGKNLLPPADSGIYYKGTVGGGKPLIYNSSLVISNFNNIDVSSYNGVYAVIKLTEGETYTLTVNNLVNNCATKRIWLVAGFRSSESTVFGTSEMDNAIVSTNYNPSSLTFTVPSGYPYCLVGFYNYPTVSGDTVSFDAMQLEEGTTATSYTPYVPNLTAVKISRYGKNLFDKSIPISNYTTLDNSYKYLKYYVGTGTNVTVSIAEKPTVPNDNGFMYVYPNTTPKADVNAKWLAHQTSPELCNQQQTVVSTDGYVCLVVSVARALDCYGNSIQIELGTTATEYEPYKMPTEYTPAADGTVSGVKALYPTTTLMTDTEGAIIEAEYNRDINKAFAELQQAILSMGGNT